MRSLRLVILLALWPIFFCWTSKAQQVDSARLARLDALLEDYYVSMMQEPSSTKSAECDFLISTCPDSLTRQHVAVNIFKHYMSSPLMGEESVAVYIYDRWFATGKVVMPDTWDEFQANMFAEFNRNNLLYMDAPVIELEDQYGDMVRMPMEDGLSIIFFYDTSCSKCKATSLLLPYALDDYDFPIFLYAVYTGNSRNSWTKFQSDFVCYNPDVEVIHVWDPDIQSNYQKMYGVTTTPKLFLIEPHGIIIGRRLEVDSLTELLNVYNLYYQNAEAQ